MLEVKNLYKVYNNEVTTLNNVNFKIEKGLYNCIVGASGSGKSTLIKIIAGLIKPTAGEILLNGKKIDGPGNDRVIMFQESALFPWLSVIDNVKFGLRIKKISAKEQERIAEEYLKMVDLYEFKDYFIHQLSGGMKQRVALARALAIDSELLLMDEPFSALDKQTTNYLRKQVEEIWEKRNKTIIMITHSVEEAVFFSDRIFMLSRKTHNIEKEYKISLKRPRDITSAEFLHYRSEILDWIKKDVEFTNKEE